MKKYHVPTDDELIGMILSENKIDPKELYEEGSDALFIADSIRNRSDLDVIRQDYVIGASAGLQVAFAMFEENQGGSAPRLLPEAKVPVPYTEERISDLISAAMSDECGISWWKPEDQDAYAASHEELKAEGQDPCVSDVFARMLIRGYRLLLLDPESDWHWSGHEEGEMMWSAQIVAEGCEPEGGEWHAVGLKDILEAIAKYGEAEIANDCGPSLRKIVDEGDFWDADAVFQIAAYGDVIYG